MFLDIAALHRIEPRVFQQERPFPWVNPYGLLTDDGYARLLAALPDLSLFTPTFGRDRKYGQKSHDRYTLKYHEALALPSPWAEFISELRGPAYHAFLKGLFGTGAFALDFFWFYTPDGCSISPHCDHKNKVGAHLFYLNTTDDWDPAWGGETLILDDGGRIERKSAPDFSAFADCIASQTIGNYSLLFSRTANSWHGMKEIACPEDRMRRVFMVAVKRVKPLDRLAQLFGKAPAPDDDYR